MCVCWKLKNLFDTTVQSSPRVDKSAFDNSPQNHIVTKRGLIRALFQSLRFPKAPSMRLGLLLLFAACIGHAIAIQISLMMGILLPKTLDVLLKLREGKNLLDLDSQEHALKNQINKVAHQIDDLHRLEVSSTSRTLSLLQSSLPDRVALDLKLNNLKEYMRKIDVYYKRMKQYAGYHTGYKVNRRSIRVRRFERFTLENFATEVVAHHPNSVQSLNAHVHEYFMPGQLGIMNSNIVKSFLKLGSVSIQ